MDIKDKKLEYGVATLSIYEPSNYSFIFKKTEKIVCAVLYITDSKDGGSNSHGKIVSYIQDIARATLDSVLEMLTSTAPEGTQSVKNLLHLQSALQMGLASGVLRADHVDVLGREIDDVLKNVHALVNGDERSGALLTNLDRVYTHAVREQKMRVSGLSWPSREVAEHPSQTRAGVERNATSTRNGASDRREAIRSVLKSKGQASIKDIVDVITDCSEKTIQRELISMIQKGEVVREGERRWSRYKLV